MQSKLLRATTAVSHQHPDKCPESRARTSISDEIGVIEQCPTALLQMVHQGIFLVGIKRFIESAQLHHVCAPRREVAKNQFLFTRRPAFANGLISSATRPERQP